MGLCYEKPEEFFGAMTTTATTATATATTSTGEGVSCLLAEEVMGDSGGGGEAAEPEAPTGLGFAGARKQGFTAAEEESKAPEVISEGRKLGEERDQVHGAKLVVYD